MGEHAVFKRRIPEALIIKTYCNKTGKTFGIRTQKEGPNVWLMDWAFPILEEIDGEEGSQESYRLQGALNFADEYPGCPHCGTGYLYKCGTCGAMNDRFPNDEIMKCGGCGLDISVDSFVDTNDWSLSAKKM